MAFENALVQGASRGLGLGFVRRLLADGVHHVFASCRNPEGAIELHSLREEAAGRLHILRLDVEDEASVGSAAEAVGSRVDRLDLVLNVSGLLHGGGVEPEKKLGHVDPRSLERVFRVNAFGPLLVAKHFERLVVGKHPAVFASLSARVGSIGDNRRGGWYAYRASKAAQNMFTKNLAIEWGRKSKTVAAIGLHPGTVDTGLSKPFQRSVPEGKLFSVDQSVDYLLGVCQRVRIPEGSGQVFAWDGQAIPW